MKLIIDIPEWQYKSICEGIAASKRCGVVGVDPTIHEAIANGTPIQSVSNVTASQVKDLPPCKECRTCRNCKSKNTILPHIIWMNGSPFIYCRKHKEHFAPNDTCEF